MGLYEPTKGKVSIDNTQLRNYKLDWFSKLDMCTRNIDK